ncbi:MAG TPA: SDR family NAD(P)-dependent oxidoreductase, partial [Solirubrobacteraceae bacterium]|nr:SDR family NAD(P)-dependent oxidoreductase [Solirubrobacteraceae bacterium]
MRLEGKVCVVTGACGGIGAATVATFEREGARVVGADLAPGAPGEVSVQVDVADEQQVSEMYASVVQQLGRIDVLFNNAGISPTDDASVLETSAETWQRVQDVNLKSV